MPSQRGYYEGILELRKKMGLTDLSGPFNSKTPEFQLLTTSMFLNGTCMIVTSSVFCNSLEINFGWVGY